MRHLRRALFRAIAGFGFAAFEAARVASAERDRVFHGDFGVFVVLAFFFGFFGALCRFFGFFFLARAVLFLLHAQFDVRCGD